MSPDRFLGYFSDRYLGPRRQELTPRQADVLRCYSHGLNDSMTADMLGISVETVKEHLDRARRRLAAKNTTHAVAIAVRHGLID